MKHLDDNDVAHLIECAHCQKIYKNSAHTVWVMGGMEGPCPLCGEESGFHDDDGGCHASDTVDETVKPPLVKCADHSKCSIDPISGEHVDIEVGTRRRVQFKVTWKKLGRHYHCRFWQRLEPSSTWQLCGNLTMDEASWPAFKIGEYSLEPELPLTGDVL